MFPGTSPGMKRPRSGGNRSEPRPKGMNPMSNATNSMQRTNAPLVEWQDGRGWMMNLRLSDPDGRFVRVRVTAPDNIFVYLTERRQEALAVESARQIQSVFDAVTYA
jgi:hypothetical protein